MTIETHREKADILPEVIEGEVVENGNGEGRSPVRRNIIRLPKGVEISQGTFSALQVIKELGRQALETDEETRRLVAAVLQERLETDYLRSMVKNDKRRVFAFVQQVNRANAALSVIAGSKVTLPSLYRSYSEENPGTYPALNSPEGLQAFFQKFYPEIVSNVLSAAVIASEKAEIDEQKAQAASRMSLEVIRIENRVEIARALAEHGPEIKAGEELKGEIEASKRKGFIKTTLGVITAIPVILARSFSDELGKWVEENPKVAVPAAIGGIAGASLVGYALSISEFVKVWIATSSYAFPQMATMVFGGAVAGAVGAITLTHIGTGIAEGARDFIDNSETIRRLKSWVSRGSSSSSANSEFEKDEDK